MAFVRLDDFLEDVDKISSILKVTTADALFAYQVWRDTNQANDLRDEIVRLEQAVRDIESKISSFEVVSDTGNDL